MFIVRESPHIHKPHRGDMAVDYVLVNMSRLRRLNMAQVKVFYDQTGKYIDSLVWQSAG